MESNVFRPMISGCPVVSRLNRAQSAGIRHGMSASAPMTPLRATAAMATTCSRLDGTQTAIGALIEGYGSYASIAMSAIPKPSMSRTAGLSRSVGSGRGSRSSWMSAWSRWLR